MPTITSIGRDICALLLESTMNKAIAATLRIKCLLCITGALILFGLAATLAFAIG